MEITKVVKPFIRRGANTFGNVLYLVTKILQMIFLYLKQKKETDTGLERLEGE